MRELNGLSLGQFSLALACSTFIHKYYLSDRKFLFVVKSFIKLLIFRDTDHQRLYQEFTNRGSKTLVSYATSRETHKKLIQGYIRRIGIERNHMIYHFEGNCEICFNFQSFLEAIYYCKKNHLFRNFRLDMLMIFLAVFELINSKKEIDLYFSNDSNDINYICLNSAWSLENLYTQHFRSLGCQTFTFQHAAFCDFEHALPIELNNYSNIQSDYFLAWGEFTVSQVSKYFPDDVKILYVGNPIVEDFFQKTKYSSAEAKNNVMFIALPRIFYRDEIMDLLKLLESIITPYDYLLKVRLHPSMTSKVFFECLQENSNLDIEIDEYPSIQQAIMTYKPGMIVSFNSSIIFELLNFSEIIYLFLSKRNDFKISQLSSFSNTSEFVNLMGNTNRSKVPLEYFFDGKDLPYLKKLLAS